MTYEYPKALAHRREEILFFRERHLLFREAAHGAEAHGHAERGEHDPSAAAQEGARQRIAASRRNVQEQAHAAAPQSHPTPDTTQTTPHPEVPYQYPPLWEPKPLPPFPKEDFKRTAKVGFFLALPPLAVTVGAGMWAWNTLAKKVPPVRWVDTGVRKAASTVGEGLRSVGRTLAYPFKPPATLVMNAARPALRLSQRILHKVFVDWPHDLKRGFQKKYSFDENTDTLAMVTFGAKAIALYPLKLAKSVWDSAIQHPKTAAAIGLGLLGAHLNPGGIPAAAQQFVKLIFDILARIASGSGGAP